MAASSAAPAEAGGEQRRDAEREQRPQPQRPGPGGERRQADAPFDPGLERAALEQRARINGVGRKQAG